MSNKTKPISKLKKELDKWFSLYIRLRKVTPTGIAECYTCGKLDYYKNLQCGHFQSRRKHNTRWNEQNCQVQCVGCNMFKQGEQFKFGIKLNIEYGSGTTQELQFLANQRFKFTRVDYEENIRYYKAIVNNLKKDLGLE